MDKQLGEAFMDKLWEKMQFSQWKKVLSEFLKRSMNGPLLFNIVINSIGKKTSSKITKLDNDNNSFKVRKTRTSWEELTQFQTSLS